MISNLAKGTVEEWKAEGLTPSFEDTVYLNALGLKVERNQEMYMFGAVPRTAFLGDMVLSEPTVAKRIWMDRASDLLGRDYFTQLCFTAWSLYCPDRELPEATDVDEIVKQVAAFKDDALLPYAESQIFKVVDYVLNGAEHTTGEDFKDDEKKDRPFGYDIPAETCSAAKQLLCEAVMSKIPAEIQNEVTVRELDRMIIVAALREGADVLKSQHAENSAKFYAAAGRIHKRLREEKAKSEEKRHG